MALSVIQSKYNLNTTLTNQQTLAFSSSVTSASLIVVGLAWADTSITVSSVKDNVNNTNFTSAKSQSLSGTGVSALYYFPNSASGSMTVTITFSGSVEPVDIWLYEVGGAATSSPNDGSGNSSTGTSATPTSGSFSTSNANDILFGVTCVGNSITATESGWTGSIGGTSGNAAEYDIVSSTSSYSATFTQSSGTYTAVGYAFQQASSVTDLNSTVTLNPETVLTLSAQMAQQPSINLQPETILGLSAQMAQQPALSASPETIMTLQEQQLDNAVLAPSPATTLNLGPSIFTPNLFATVTFNPGTFLTLSANDFSPITINQYLIFPPGNINEESLQQ